MKIAKDFSTYGLENSENNAYPGCDVRPGMLDRGRDAAATKTVGELISGRYRLSCPWAYRTAMAGPRDGMPTSRELSLEMIGKTRRISKLTPSAAPSVVARGFRDSYRSDGLWLFPETSVPVYDDASHGHYLTGTRATLRGGCSARNFRVASPSLWAMLPTSAFSVAHPASSFGSPLCISCTHGSIRRTHSPARSSRCSS